MKVAVLILCLVGVAFGKYTDQYDNIDVKEILDNQRLLNSYVDCLMERGKCTPAGISLKENVRDALEHGCSECTETQKEKADIVLNHFIDHDEAVWVELCDKYDPTGKYRKEYEAKNRKLKSKK